MKVTMVLTYLFISFSSALKLAAKAKTIEEPTVFKQILSNTPSLTELKITETMKQSLTGWWDNNGNYRGPWFDLFTGKHGLIFSRFDWDRHGNYRERRGASTDKDNKRRRASTNEDIVGSNVGDLAVGSDSTPTTAPTAVPTSTPTSVPTAAPTPTPTSTPTAVPTPAPTQASVTASYTLKGNGYCRWGHLRYWNDLMSVSECFQWCLDYSDCSFFAVSSHRCDQYGAVPTAAEIQSHTYVHATDGNYCNQRDGGTDYDSYKINRL